VIRLAQLAAANNGLLAAVERPPAIVIEADGTLAVPTSFSSYGEDPKVLYVTKPISIEASFTAPASGSYGIWVGGLWRARLEAWVDGKWIGSARDVLAWPSNFVELGRVRLGAGAHLLRIRYSGPDLHPGSAGRPGFGLGPFAVGEGTGNRRVTYVQPSNSRSLCGRPLDWIEALRG
jgi:hypothetical protein